jgi:hypothetical protein
LWSAYAREVMTNVCTPEDLKTLRLALITLDISFKALIG